jgi:hypothetical protein
MANSTPSSAPVLAATPVPAVPILHELRISKDAEEWLKTLSPGIFQNYDDLQKTWNAPLTQFTITLVQDADFKLASQQIYNSHLGSTLVSYELVLILVLWIIRSWRLGKASTWLLRIWTQAWIAVVYWLLAVFLVPYLVWGDAYRILLKQISKAILRHFFT